MTIGQKIALLKGRLNFRNYQEFGKFLDLSGDWLLDMTKKAEVTTVDITRLITIAVRCKVSLDWLLLDKEDDGIITLNNLESDDLLLRLDELQTDISEKEVSFNGSKLNDKQKQLAIDGIIVLKQLINSGI